MPATVAPDAPPMTASVLPEIEWEPSAAGAAPPLFFLWVDSWPSGTVEVCCPSATITLPCRAATITESSYSTTSYFDWRRSAGVKVRPYELTAIASEVEPIRLLRKVQLQYFWNSLFVLYKHYSVQKPKFETLLFFLQEALSNYPLQAHFIRQKDVNDSLKFFIV